MNSSRVTLPAGGAGTDGASTLVAQASSATSGQTQPGAGVDLSPGDTVVIRNRGTVPAFLGATGQASTQSFELAAGATLPPLQLDDGEAIFARVNGTTAGALDVMVLNRA